MPEQSFDCPGPSFEYSVYPDGFKTFAVVIGPTRVIVSSILHHKSVLEIYFCGM